MNDRLRHKQSFCRQVQTAAASLKQTPAAFDLMASVLPAEDVISILLGGLRPRRRRIEPLRARCLFSAGAAVSLLRRIGRRCIGDLPLSRNSPLTGAPRLYK